MASRVVKEPLKMRKERLIKQSEMQRRDLRADAAEFCDAAGWIEQGHSFFRAADTLRKWKSPFQALQSGKQKNLTKLLGGCVVGFGIWRKLRSR